MKQTLTRRLIGLFLLALSLASPYASADSINGTGTVYLLRPADSSVGSDLGYILVNGFSGAGTCLTTGANPTFVIMRVRGDRSGDRLFALALAAQSMGRTVTVTVNDDVKDAIGACFLRYIYFIN